MVSYSTNEPIGQGVDGTAELPLFMKVAAALENDILRGLLDEDDQAPSTNEIANFHRINPATALRGVAHLADAGVLYKRRGIGMFVAPGARERILAARRTKFTEDFVRPLLAEAALLGIAPDALATLVAKEANHEQ